VGMLTKTCSACAKELPIEEFTPLPGLCGVEPRCAVCVGGVDPYAADNIAVAKWRAAHAQWNVVATPLPELAYARKCREDNDAAVRLAAVDRLAQDAAWRRRVVAKERAREKKKVYLAQRYRRLRALVQ